MAAPLVRADLEPGPVEMLFLVGLRGSRLVALVGEVLEVALMPDIWYPKAQRLDGPSKKTSRKKSWPKQGAVYHSAEGTWPGMRSVLSGTRKSSWHFSNLKDGTLYQHYSLDVVAWHARGGNTANFGVENEGFKGEDLTTAQVKNLVGITAWAKKECGWGKLSRVQPGRNLWEHNEISPTECPSDRIPWAKVIKRAQSDDGMPTKAERKARAAAAAVMTTAAEYAARGITPPTGVVNKVLAYAGVWKQQSS